MRLVSERSELTKPNRTNFSGGGQDSAAVDMLEI